MADEHDFSIQGSEPRTEEERRKRELLLGPLVLPGSDRVYEPSRKDVMVNVSDAVRTDSGGMITDRWNRLSFAGLHRQLERNASGLAPSS